LIPPQASLRVVETPRENLARNIPPPFAARDTARTTVRASWENNRTTGAAAPLYGGKDIGKDGMKGINQLLRHTWFPLAAQLFMLGAFALLIAGGLSANTDDMAFAVVLRNTNLANLIVWSYWWPLIILSAIFFGRIWCMVCPMELIASLASRIGIKRKPPALLRSGWVITAFYILILFVGIHTLAVHRVPFRMAVYMLVLLAAAIVTGLLFSRNTFCAHVCPVGHLLGLYARLAPMGWRVKDAPVCEKCRDKSCISDKKAYEFQGRSCGVWLYPPKIEDNTQCLLCGQCLKACDRNNPGDAGRPNPGWFSRRWFEDVLELKPLTPAQLAFCLVVSGFVVYEVFTEWSTTKGLLLWAPAGLERILGAEGPLAHALVKSLTLFVALPALVWSLPFVVFRLVGGKLPFKDYLLRFGIAFIPIMAAAHAFKALLKTTSRIPYWRYAVADPAGLEAARQIVDKTAILSPLPAWRTPLLTVLSLLFMGVGVALSAVVVRKLAERHPAVSGPRSAALYLLPALYGGAFIVMLTAWRIM